MEKMKIDNLKEIAVDLPASVTEPKPEFKDNESALQHYGQQVEAIAASKSISVESLRVKANNFEFGSEESFKILSLFDTLRALKASW